MSKCNLTILVIEDDAEYLKDIEETVPEKILNHKIYWEFCNNFKLAFQAIQKYPYDLIISDVYLDDKKIAEKDKTPKESETPAFKIIEEIRENHACPIVLFTSGQQPKEQENNFIKIIDKSSPNAIEQIIDALEIFIETNIPPISRMMRDAINKSSGSYLWNFIEENWDKLKDLPKSSLEKVIMSRAATMLTTLESAEEETQERDSIKGAEYYYYPPISADLRLGMVLKHIKTEKFWIVLTPHCLVKKQPEEELPKAENILLAATTPADNIIISNRNHKMTKKIRIKEFYRKATSIRSNLGIPKGRFAFIPGFLEIPDLFCDFLQLKSVEYQIITKDYKQIASLISPFSESLQNGLIKLYSSIGTVDLDFDDYQSKIEKLISK